MQQPSNPQRTIALIPLRGGSVSIPGKNVKLIAGKPLCAWNIEAAVQSGIFQDVIVSTDCDEIASVVQSLDLNVTVLKRPKELATSSATSESVMLHCADHFEFDVMTLIQATTPFALASDFVKAGEKLINENLDSLLTAVQTKHFFWTSDGSPVNYTPQNRPMRQDFDGLFRENGCFYMTRKKTLLEEKCRLGGNIGIYEMPFYSAIDIDEEDDWLDAENRIRKYILKSDQSLSKVKIFISDVDGVLTDGGMYYSEDGDELKRFNTRDGKGFELLGKAGIKTALITSEETNLVERRARKLRIDYLFQGKTHGGKLNAIKEICAREKVTTDEVAYIGDDMNCLDALKGVGFPACPSDAVISVKDVSGIKIMSKTGGHGVVREYADLILQSRNEHDKS